MIWISVVSKRRHLSLQIKLDSCLIRLGIDPKKVEYHHDPPLNSRYIDEDGNYVPDELDPRYIVPMSKEEHRARTPDDIKRVAKVKRMGRKEQEHIDRILSVEKKPRSKYKWPKRKVRWQKKP